MPLNNQNRRKNKLDVLAYSIIWLYNIKQEIKNIKDDFKDFCENTSIKNQLHFIVKYSKKIAVNQN